MKRLYIIITLLALTFATAYSQTKAEADSAYLQGDYQKAITIYENMLKEGENAKVYYNLGNAYYRTEDIAHAILNYERALKLQPAYSDAKFNLQMAQTKTIDKITPESEMFFVTWYRQLSNIMSIDSWGWVAIIALVLAFAALLLYLFSTTMLMRKAGFIAAIVMIVVVVVSHSAAMSQGYRQKHRSEGIIMQTAVKVKSTPAANGTDIFVLHEGTKVRVTDNSMKDWREVSVADGKQGWILKTDIEEI